MIAPKTYDILDRCVADGITFGYARAFKHTDAPSDQDIKENIHREVMNEISTWFNFEPGVKDEIDS